MTNTPPEPTTQTETKTPQPLPLSLPLSLTDEPAQIAAYLKSQTTENDTFKFADFITTMNMAEFDDVYQIRDILESQIQVLGATFHYLMLEGDCRNLPLALRAQKMMMETINTMNGYPSKGYRRDMQARFANKPTQHA